MTPHQTKNLDNKTINQLGLRISDKHINAHIAPDARVFEYPHLTNVFVMENDLYGNIMPKNSCFLAFVGKHGLMGQQMSVDTLKNSSVEEICNIINKNNEG